MLMNVTLEQCKIDLRVLDLPGSGSTENMTPHFALNLHVSYDTKSFAGSYEEEQ